MELWFIIIGRWYDCFDTWWDKASVWIIYCILRYFTQKALKQYKGSWELTGCFSFSMSPSFEIVNLKLNMLIAWWRTNSMLSARPLHKHCHGRRNVTSPSSLLSSCTLTSEPRLPTASSVSSSAPGGTSHSTSYTPASCQTPRTCSYGKKNGAWGGYSWTTGNLSPWVDCEMRFSGSLVCG